MSKIVDWFASLPAERKALCVFIPLILLSMVSAWYDKTPVPPTKVYIQATPISGTAVTKTSVAIKTEHIKVIPKSIIKKSIKDLPIEIENPAIEVMDTAEVAPSENGTKVISTINKETGDTQIILKENQAPLFAFVNKRRIGVGYGIGTNGATAKVFGEWTFLRVGSFHTSLQSEINVVTARAPEAKAMVVIDYRW